MEKHVISKNRDVIDCTEIPSEKVSNYSRNLLARFKKWTVTISMNVIENLGEILLFFLKGLNLTHEIPSMWYWL